MPLGPYQGSLLTPGMGSPVYSAEHDLMGLVYGSPHHLVYMTHVIIDGSARDAGNTADTTVLRPGLVLGQVTATQKWKQFDSTAVDGSEIPAGILTELGLNTQMDGGNTDRFLATVLVGGNINPDAVCIAANATYGLSKAALSDGLDVRKAFKYAFRLSDDFMGYVAEPFASR